MEETISANSLNKVAVSQSDVELRRREQPVAEQIQHLLLSWQQQSSQQKRRAQQQ